MPSPLIVGGDGARALAVSWKVRSEAKVSVGASKDREVVFGLLSPLGKVDESTLSALTSDDMTVAGLLPLQLFRTSLVAFLLVAQYFYFFVGINLRLRGARQRWRATSRRSFGGVEWA